MRTVVTTAGRATEELTTKALSVANALGYSFEERKKKSIHSLFSELQSNILVVGNTRIEYFQNGMEEPLFFHPNLAMIRLKRLLQGQQDPLQEVANLRAGDSFLDCTLGFGADSIIASHVVGETGRVVGLEANKNVAYITAEGLRTFMTNIDALTEAMRRIEVVQTEAIHYLASLPNNSWDVVYIDPMFSEPVEESTNFTILREVGEQHFVTKEWIEQAVRVAKRVVVVKDHYKSPLFERFGMDRQVRPTSKFHYGKIMKSL